MFAGIDGCKKGWLSILLDRNNRWKIVFYENIQSFWENNYDAELILIDIPIGLSEKGSQERKCDIEARKILGPKRGSSIFQVPCRDSLYAKTYEDANNIHSRLTGRKLSIQTWNILPKIREIDFFLQSERKASTKIRESHPEICFWAFSGHPMNYSKRKLEGILERKELLKSIYPQTEDLLSYALSTYKKSGIKVDDVLDALILALTAKMGFNRLNFIPQMLEFDSRGLPMEIVYYPYYFLSPLKCKKTKETK
ncbi:MAG: DUF429 domain-containing protein [Actinobacteria bacterium]|nr:DUF429 domain-containing protein [Actinomycetota bacterium]